MKISSFEPLILTKNATSVIELFEALGFEKQHNKVGEIFDSIRLKDANGFHVDVTQVEFFPQDVTSIRMNVESFDEAAKLLTERGFKNASGDTYTDTGTSHSAMFVSPSGFSISVCEHTKG